MREVRPLARRRRDEPVRQLVRADSGDGEHLSEADQRTIEVHEPLEGLSRLVRLPERVTGASPLLTRLAADPIRVGCEGLKLSA